MSNSNKSSLFNTIYSILYYRPSTQICCIMCYYAKRSITPYNRYYSYTVSCNQNNVEIQKTQEFQYTGPRQYISLYNKIHNTSADAASVSNYTCDKYMSKRLELLDKLTWDPVIHCGTIL